MTQGYSRWAPGTAGGEFPLPYPGRTGRPAENPGFRAESVTHRGTPSVSLAVLLVTGHARPLGRGGAMALGTRLAGLVAGIMLIVGGLAGHDQHDAGNESGQSRA